MTAILRETVIPPASPARSRDLKRVLFTFGKFVGLLAILWVLFYLIWSSFPFIRNGSTIVYESKESIIDQIHLFPPTASRRIIIFGNSKILSGFQPHLFDSLSGAGVSSYNMGLPDRVKFIPTLRRIIAHGDVPTDILITYTWPKTQFRPSIFNPFENDDEIATTLFPFRYLPRDLFIFHARAKTRGGVRAFYNEGRRIVQQMNADRGYYFIEGQSRFPGHRLPDDFRLETDHPNLPWIREAATDGEPFDQLLALLKQHNIRAYLVPVYYRGNEYAPAADNQALRSALMPYPQFSVLGKDYFSYPNAYFADAVHLNPAGAEAYTRDLHALLDKALNQK